jgi:hypothetical protein
MNIAPMPALAPAAVAPAPADLQRSVNDLRLASRAFDEASQLAEQGAHVQVAEELREAASSLLDSYAGYRQIFGKVDALPSYRADALAFAKTFADGHTPAMPDTDFDQYSFNCKNAADALATAIAGAGSVTPAPAAPVAPAA